MRSKAVILQWITFQVYNMYSINIYEHVHVRNGIKAFCQRTNELGRKL